MHIVSIVLNQLKKKKKLGKIKKAENLILGYLGKRISYNFSLQVLEPEMHTNERPTFFCVVIFIIPIIA